MDERQFKKIMQDIDVPASDENAKKQALNLSMSEFEEVQKEKQKNFQGSSLLHRLMGSSNQNKRRRPMTMNKRMTYGGMATAMAVVLVTAVSVQQYNTGSYKGDTATDAVLELSAVDAVSEMPAMEETQLFRGLSEKSDRDSVSLRQNKEQFASSDKKNSASRTRMAKNEFRVDAPEAIAPLSSPLGENVPVKGLLESKVMREKRKQGRIAGQGFVGKAIRSEEATVAAFSSLPHHIIADDEQMPGAYKDVGRDQFESFEVNPVKLVSAEPVSTFSIDVDTSSYSFIRKQIMSGVLPQKDAVRIEEMVNYFGYDYPLPETKERPFESSVTVVPSPWKDGNKLVHIGIKGFDIDADAVQPRSNLVFLLDVSGSMSAPDKMPLMVNSLKLLLESLQPEDTVGIVVYAGAAGTVLEPTAVKDKSKILDALNRLSAGGSTAGAAGIRQAYQLAESNFDKEAVNRVILATDGDFNVGITNRDELKGFIERKRETGIFLSVFGFGQGNYNDHLMQELAQNGNGVAAYIDTLSEARKILVDEATSTLFPIAKDVKIQVDFNPATVAEYRLVGYETRHLNREDFNNDAVDAGDIGAGHTVTAIYEITPVGGPRTVDDSRYQAIEEHSADTAFSNEYAFLKIRYKLPNQDKSTLITTPITMDEDGISPLMKQEAGWATAVAGFGQLLKGEQYTGKLTFDDVIVQAQSSKGDDEFGYRAEFIQLVRLAQSVASLP